MLFVANLLSGLTDAGGASPTAHAEKSAHGTVPWTEHMSGLPAMTDSTTSPDGDPGWSTVSDAATGSVGAATDGLKLAYEIHRQAMEA